MDTKIMQELGYRLNFETLKQELFQGTGNQLTDQGRHYFQGIAPYLVLAYRQGLEDKPLNEVFPFLVPVEEAGKV